MRIRLILLTAALVASLGASHCEMPPSHADCAEAGWRIGVCMYQAPEPNEYDRHDCPEAFVTPEQYFDAVEVFEVCLASELDGD